MVGAEDLTVNEREFWAAVAGKIGERRPLNPKASR
jgi:hypothetical protein